MPSSSPDSKQEIQARLTAAGYDSTLADPYFKNGGSGTEQSAVAATTFEMALAKMGLLGTPGREEREADTAAVLEPKTSGALKTGVAPKSYVFGKDIFARAVTVFDPINSGPVDVGYRLGVGDALQLIVTGQVELAYQLELRRDGSVVIPQVGQVVLAGLTLEGARTLLKERMSASYSGLSTGGARLDLSVARLRTNSIFVIGEVEQPGALQVNALATVFHAIARAGGPTERGSFRNIEVRRGGKVIQKIDLYDYLMNGDATADIRLDQGDVIFVPLNQRTVSVVGAVRRPRTFELRDGESFARLLTFAGGLSPKASVERVQVDRIVPADRRAPGFERVKVDVEIKGRLDSLGRVGLIDGDVVTVFEVGNVRRNVVTVEGEVFHPGEFELRPNLTLGRVLADAQGMAPWGLADRVKVIRLSLITGQKELFSLDVTTPAGRDFPLREYDVVQVLDGRLGFPGDSVYVEGAVNYSNEAAGIQAVFYTDSWARRVNRGLGHPWIANESLRDAIDRAGGLREDASSVDVFRRKVGATFSDTTSVRLSFALATDGDRARDLGSVMLQRNDRVVVRSSPGFRPQRFVGVAGQFAFGGQYAIIENVDRIRDIVTRAGGALPGAQPESFHLVRQGKLVSVDFRAAMRGEAYHNIPLVGGDSIIISKDPLTVLVTGGVNRPSLLQYRPGFTAQDYIDLAGGPVERGEPGKAIVQYPSGFSRQVKKFAFFFHRSPEIVSGSVISVPVRPEDTGNSLESWSRIIGIASAITSTILAIAAVRKL